MLARFFKVKPHPFLSDVALVPLRVVVGIALMHHGYGKVQSPFEWMGPDSWAPPFLQGLAALSEFGGGLGLALGLLTPLSTLGIACTMATAAFTHLVIRGDPFVAKGGGPAGELASVFFCVAALYLLNGPGRFSVDRVLFGAKS